MSRTFSINSGSSEILKDSTTCGCNPKVRQMRPTVEALTPACSAILRVLQWVRPFGLLSSVVTRIDSTSASDTVRGAPGLGSSYSASTRPTLNRCRHVPPVTCEQRSFAATATFDSPRALLRTILARKATCRFVRARLASRSSSTRSAAVTSNLALGRPVLGMPPNTSQPTNYLKLFQTQGTSRFLALTWKPAQGRQPWRAPRGRYGCVLLRETTPRTATAEDNFSAAAPLSVSP